MRIPEPVRNPVSESIGKGLEEANNLLFFNKKGDDKSKNIIIKAMENLEKETWHSPCNKMRCKQKLVAGLNRLKSGDAEQPIITYVKRKRGRPKKNEQSTLLL